jgi:hypothetical protein
MIARSALPPETAWKHNMVAIPTGARHFLARLEHERPRLLVGRRRIEIASLGDAISPAMRQSPQRSLDFNQPPLDVSALIYREIPAGAHGRTGCDRRGKLG